MALPKDIEELLAPADVPPLTEGWSRDFSPYRFCRLAGFPWGLNKDKTLRAKFSDSGALRPLGQGDSEDWLKQPHVLEEAKRRVPKEWRNHEEFSHLDWSRNLGKDQVAAAFKGKQPLAFDRACMVVAALDFMFEKTGHGGKYVGDYVRIAPAIFRLPGFTPTFFKTNFGGSRQAPSFTALMALTAQVKPTFWVDLANGGGATHATLQKIVEALGKLEIAFDGVIEPFSERINGTKAADFEYATFPGA
jgi:hypothetical protein